MSVTDAEKETAIVLSQLEEARTEHAEEIQKLNDRIAADAEAHAKAIEKLAAEHSKKVSELNEDLRRETDKYQAASASQAEHQRIGCPALSGEWGAGVVMSASTGRWSGMPRHWRPPWKQSRRFSSAGA